MAPKKLNSFALRLCGALLALLAVAALSFCAAPAPATAKARVDSGGTSKARPGQAHRHRHDRRHHRRHHHRRPRAALGSAMRVAGRVAVVKAPHAKSGVLLDAGFENDLANWNTAGVGEVVPTVTTSAARSGSKACRVVLTGDQDRSELILGGNGGGSTAGTVEFEEGDEYWFGFSFNLQRVVYGEPGAHNLIMQFKSDGEGSPNFGLQLWDTDGKKGLWTGGPAQEVDHDGERFLAPLAEGVWHDVQIHFKASSVGAGFYETYLDGKLVDAQSGVSMIVPGHSSAYIKNGLYRNGGTAPGTEEILLDAATLGTTQTSVAPS